ncbi:hypothetical protein [Sporosarcina sp. E16_8]|uniref:TcaA NTF2-like domain-containing protein n=1 Tax=Sporosarcina sp. E16_8 TaxID=2789295 RepID=UPI001A91838B|nr:hypothetical protein [Sporosarcina sp. E16_8]MBO0589675.1 hypothetical protein [Sporosarcina sp. E16_8]
MSRFCLECGQQVTGEDVVCTNCGTKLPQVAVMPKQPLSKKKKVLYGIITAIAVLLIGFTVWGKAHFSQETTAKRFAEALSTKDAKQLQSLVVRENGKMIDKQEAKAMLKLAEAEGRSAVDSLSTVQQHGKWFGLFKIHKVEVIDQYAYFEGPLNGLTFTFNGVEIREESRKKGSVSYGPLSPGIYEVNATFEGKYGKGSSKSELYADNNSGKPSWIEVELPLGNAMFEVTNYSSEVMLDARIVINEEDIPVDEYGATEEIGPILFDGSQHAKLAVRYPWGEVTSSEMTIESEYQEIEATILSQDEMNSVVDTLTQFGEEYIKAKSKRDTSSFTTTTKSFNALYLENILDPLIDNNAFVTGKFDQLDVDEDSVYLLDDSEPGITIQAEFTYMEDSHSLLDTPSISESVYTYDVNLIYDESANRWFIQNATSTRSNIAATKTIPGSGAIHQPSSDAVHKEKDRLIKEELQSFFEYYVSRSVDAINTRDFSYVEHLMTDDGPRKKEAKDYIVYLESKGITEQFIAVTVDKVEAAGTNTWKVTSTDEFIIYNPDGSKNRKYTTVVIVKKVDGDWLVHELVSTVEI